MLKLFTSTNLGPYTLKNRIVMAPLTRSRAEGNIPNDLMATYYADRADAGLIITEGTSPSPNGLGYPRIPGLFTEAQVAGWKKITSRVHAEDGRIFVQLMHTGRVSHAFNLPKGARILAPSAIRVNGQMFTDKAGLQEYPTPEAMTLEEIAEAKKEYVKASELAMEAGFDGVELHGANGYLIEQFLNPKTNQRTDEYGGSDENRMRFALEVSAEIAEKIGAGRLGMRVSPYGTNADTGAFEGIDLFYGTLAKKLSNLRLAYLHVVDHSSMGAPKVSNEVKKQMRQKFLGKYILSGGYTAETAEKDLLNERGDLVAFGRPFISNPKLVEKLRSSRPLLQPNPATFYTPGPEGYTDYPKGI